MKKHLQNVYRKLGGENRVAAATCFAAAAELFDKAKLPLSAQSPAE